MLGPCFPMMQATMRIVARPFHHVVHHLTRSGIGHQLHHTALHPGLAGTAGPQAGGVSMTCVQAPGGLLPAGPVPSAAGSAHATSAYASNVGNAGNGAAFGPASSSSMTAALGGGVLGSSLSSSGGLAGSVGPLASAALLAVGLAMAASSAATTAPDQPALQQFAAADRVQPLPFIAAPILAAPVLAVLAAPAAAIPVAAMAPLPGRASGATTPDATPGTRIPDTPAPSGVMMPDATTPSTRTSVPASLALLGIGVAATWAARRQSSRRR